MGPCIQTILLSLFGFLTFLVGGAQENFSALIYTFGVEYMTWSPIASADLLTVFGIAQIFGRLISIALALILRDSILMGFDIALALIPLVTLSLCVNSNSWVMWLCTVFLGLTLSPCFPFSFSWARQVMGVSGLNNGIIYAGNQLGKVVTPPLVAFLFETVLAA